MITYYLLDSAVSHCFPQLLLILPLPNGRTTLKLSGIIRDIVSLEREIVVARLDAERDASTLSRPDHGQGSAGRQMDDVTPDLCFFTETYDLFYCYFLHLLWARLQKCTVLLRWI